MITKLPEWYRILSVQNLQVDILENRSEAIKRIIKNKDFKWIFDCIRYFLGKQTINQKFVEDLTTSFIDSDPLFPQKDNGLELQVLTGAILNEIVESKHKEKISTGLAMQCSVFGMDLKQLICTDIFQDISNVLNEESLKQRELEEKKNTFNLSIDIALADNSAATIQSMLSKFQEQIQKLNSHYHDKLDTYAKKISLLEEESNIHWWIFKGFSNVLNKPIKEIDYESMPIIIGKDLEILTKYYPYPVAYKHFLKKIIKDAYPSDVKEISFKDAINSLKKHNLNCFTIDISTIGYICPIIMAYNLALQSGNDTGWISIFETNSGLKANMKLSVLELAIQSYLESLLVRSINNRS